MVTRTTPFREVDLHDHDDDGEDFPPPERSSPQGGTHGAATLKSEGSPELMLLTVGHGRLNHDRLAGLLTGAGIELLVDIRRFPGSSTNAAAARGAVPEITHATGIDYRWEEDLGGRRTLDAAGRRASPDTWWRVEAFRAYSSWTRDPAFHAALERVVADARSRPTAVMCSESVWWRCHRRIVADVVTTVHQLTVGHLMHSGEVITHTPSDGLRLDGNGEPVWDR